MKVKKTAVPKKDGSGYENAVVVNGVTYRTEELVQTSAKTQNGVVTTVSKTDGSVVYTYMENAKSPKYDIWKIACTSDVAKDKEINRRYVVKENIDIIEYFKRCSEYLQVSTGLCHLEREVVVVDIDEHFDDFETAKNAAVEKTEILNELGVGHPSMFQIHLDNLHIQMYYILSKPLVVEEIKIKQKKHVRVSLPQKDEYIMAYKFMASAVGGDTRFSGWQIKNPFVSDTLFANRFVTYFYNNGKYTTDKKQEYYTKHNFDDICGAIKEYFKEDGVAKLTKLKGRVNIADKVFEFVKKGMGEKIVLENKHHSGKAEMKTVHKISGCLKAGDPDYWKSMSRNEFTIKFTLMAIRESNGKMEKVECMNYVWNALQNICNSDGTLNGTKNRGAYTAKEFENTFNGAYTHGIDTFSPMHGFTEEDREKSAFARQQGKNAKLIKLYDFLTANPKYIDNSTKINKELSKLTSTSPSTLKSYKNKLGIHTKRHYEEMPLNIAECVNMNEYLAYREELQEMHREFAECGNTKNNQTWENRIDVFELKRCC